MGKIIEVDSSKAALSKIQQGKSVDGNELVIIYKIGLYWIAKGVRWKGMYGTTYQIDYGLDHNGFEGISDAYSYLVKLAEGNK